MAKSKEGGQESLLKPICGIVMPISTIDGIEPDHWSEVLGILKDVAKDAGFNSDLVSAAEFAGVIQSRIVENLYQNEIVIVDVSAKNPNVMFELGLRLAFDKATIVIMDDQTDISFDTGPIEHLIYPRDLRHGKIVLFKEQLKRKLVATFEKSKDPEYSTFLRHFGTFNVKGLKERDGNFNDLLLSKFEELSKRVENINRRPTNDANYSKPTLLDNHLLHNQILANYRFNVDVYLNNEDAITATIEDIKVDAKFNLSPYFDDTLRSTVISILKANGYKM